MDKSKLNRRNQDIPLHEPSSSSNNSSNLPQLFPLVPEATENSNNAESDATLQLDPGNGEEENETPTAGYDPLLHYPTSDCSSDYSEDQDGSGSVSSAPISLYDSVSHSSINSSFKRSEEHLLQRNSSSNLELTLAATADSQGDVMGGDESNYLNPYVVQQLMTELMIAEEVQEDWHAYSAVPILHSSVSTSTQDLIRNEDVSTSSSRVTEAIIDCRDENNNNNNNNEDDVLSLCSECSDSSKSSKLPNSIPPVIVTVYRTEYDTTSQKNKRIQTGPGTRILIVEPGDVAPLMREKFNVNFRALDKRRQRDNTEALAVLKKIRSVHNPGYVDRKEWDEFELREVYYRRKHLLSWQAANEMPRTKKIPFPTAIPLAATETLRSRLPKLERFRRRIIKIFGCSKYYVHEVLTQLSINNFNAKYNDMKTQSTLPGFGLQNRMRLFMMKNPKLIERDELMNYSYRDYIRANQPQVRHS